MYKPKVIYPDVYKKKIQISPHICSLNNHSFLSEEKFDPWLLKLHQLEALIRLHGWALMYPFMCRSRKGEKIQITLKVVYQWPTSEMPSKRPFTGRPMMAQHYRGFLPELLRNPIAL